MGNPDRRSELTLMTATSYDMDCYFCRDVEKWVQYVEQHNSMNGFSGDEPLPPNIIFEGVVKF